MFVVAASGIFGWLLAASRAPVVAAEFLTSLTNNPYMIFLIVIVFLLIVTGLMEEAASLIILVPVLYPLAVVWDVASFIAFWYSPPRDAAPSPVVRKSSVWPLNVDPTIYKCSERSPPPSK